VLSDAYVGLVKAAVKYDPRKRHKTATTDSEYFEKSIKGEILRGFRTRYGRENTPIKNKKGQVTGSEDRIRKVKPSVVYGMATADSLEASFNEGNEIQLIETIPSPGSGEEHIIDQISINEELSNLLEGRTVLEKEVLLRRVVLDQTQAEIGKAVGHSQMQISRIINRVAGHLRPGKPKSLKNPSNNP
jgi:RNA polymerase sigma-B factor